MVYTFVTVGLIIGVIETKIFVENRFDGVEGYHSSNSNISITYNHIKKGLISKL